MTVVIILTTIVTVPPGGRRCRWPATGPAVAPPTPRSSSVTAGAPRSR
ncbi:hypothetical protein [Tessaracoccus coleopterorum]|nr:hypothetical protein [Tessaracoccus coleopterorum]